MLHRYAGKNFLRKQRSIFKKYNVSIFPVKSITSTTASHRIPALIEQPNMKVQIIPALQDNYMYLVRIRPFTFHFYNTQDLYILVSTLQ